MHFGKSKLAIVVLLIFGFSSIAAAEANWNFKPVDGPFSLNQTGVNTSTVQVVSLTYKDPETGDSVALTPEDLEEGDRDNITYYYNKSMGNKTVLNHLYDKYWYSSFQPNFTRGDMIKYNATGTVVSEDTPVNSGETVNVTEDLNVGNLQIHMLNSLPDQVKAGSQVKVDVAVENASSNSMVTDSTGKVQVSFSNASGEIASYNLDNFNSASDSDDYENFDTYFFNSEVNFPAETNSTYLMHVEATRSSGKLPHGTWTKIVRTLPAIHGEATKFSSENGCNNEKMVSKCEQGANISIDYNITASQAESVNVSLNVFDDSGRHEIKNYSLSETSNGFFEGEVEIPDINTSKYSNKIEFVFNATNNERMHIDRRNVTVKPFVINRAGSPTGYVGSTYNLKIFLGKPYSLAPYNKTRFKSIKVNVTDSNGKLVENFTMDELEYDQSEGVMRTDLLIGSDRPAGAYDLDVRAKNLYNRIRTLNSGFNVQDLDATFEAESELTFQVNKLGTQTFRSDITNLLDTSNDLNITEDLPEQITLLNDTAQLAAQEEDFLKFEVNLSKMEDVSGSFKLSDDDTGYNRTIEVSVDAAECQITAGNLCTTTEEWINVSTDSTAEIAREVQLMHLRPGQENITFNASISGEISDYLEIEGETQNLQLSDSMKLNLLYQPESSGTYTGKVILETDDDERMEIQTALTADIPTSENGSSGQDAEASITVDPESIELGYLPEGDSASSTVEIVNSGEKTLNGISVTSDTFSVTSSGISQLDPGETGSLNVEFEDVQSESGEITIASEEAEATISVSAKPVPNYADRTSSLRERLQQLQSEVEDSGLDSQLTQASTKISQISTAWNSGNYERAQSLYNEVERTLQTVNTQVSRNNSGEGDSSGGAPILLIGGIIFFLLLAGFVFYTSYVPEEGDPLYDVLGE